jgi:acyl-CoA synthetase (AMP-forming)/AMP-acid ligase II
VTPPPRAADTIPAVVDAARDHFGDAEALVDGDVRLSFAELSQHTEEAARAYTAGGVAPGDRIAIWAPNVWEWVVAALGAYRAGATVVTLNTRFKGPEAGHILRTSGAKVLVTIAGFLDTDYLALRDQAGALPDLTETILLRGEDPRATSYDDFLARADAVPPGEVATRSQAVAPGDTSDIIFTSGTTGAPKGAMLGHSASIRAYTAWSDVVGLGADDRYLIINPFFHCFGLKAGILACLLTGATILPHPVFDVPAVMQRVTEERITMLPGPPAIYQTILDHPELDRYDLSSLRLAVTGAAAVPVEMIRRMRAELTFRTIVTGYGLTEASGIATMCRHDDDPETIAHTAGRAIEGIEVLVVQDDGTELPRGEPGEVVVRGYNVMQGYFGDPEATRTAVDAEGWLHTGDIGTMDERGNLRITDRLKDMFIVGGFNAYPAEIENIVLTHPGVAQVAVVGIEDARMGEVGMAFVVPRAGQTVDPEELVAWCRDHMANYKVPRRIELVDALPLNASGKVLKYQLRARAEGHAADA